MTTGRSLFVMASLYTYILTIKVPVVSMARYVIVLMYANPLQGPITSNDPRNGFSLIRLFSPSVI